MVSEGGRRIAAGQRRRRRYRCMMTVAVSPPWEDHVAFFGPSLGKCTHTHSSRLSSFKGEVDRPGRSSMFGDLKREKRGFNNMRARGNGQVMRHTQWIEETMKHGHKGTCVVQRKIVSFWRQFCTHTHTRTRAHLTQTRGLSV